MREGSMFLVIWDFTVLKPKMTEKKSNFIIKVFLLKREGYENKWSTKGECIDVYTNSLDSSSNCMERSF